MNSGQVTKAVISVPVTASRSALKFREKARLKRYDDSKNPKNQLAFFRALKLSNVFHNII